MEKAEKTREKGETAEKVEPAYGSARRERGPKKEARDENGAELADAAGENANKPKKGPGKKPQNKRKDAKKAKGGAKGELTSDDAEASANAETRVEG